MEDKHQVELLVSSGMNIHEARRKARIIQKRDAEAKAKAKPEPIPPAPKQVKTK